jgi:hypothetical protein
VIKLCHGDTYQAGLVFYRAHLAAHADIMGWIVEGFKGPKYYAMKPAQVETDNPKAAREWVDRVCFKIGMQRLGDILQQEDVVPQQRAALTGAQI